WHVLGWSPDDNKLLLGRELDGAWPQLELFLAQVFDGSLQPVPVFGARPRAARLRARSADAANRTPAALASEARFASDGHEILLLTRQPCQRRDTVGAHEFVHLCLTDPEDGDWRQLSASVPHDVESFD